MAFLHPFDNPHSQAWVFDFWEFDFSRQSSLILCERGKGSPRYLSLKILLPSGRAKEKVFLFLSESSRAVKAKHQGKCPETSLLCFSFPLDASKKYQTGAENGNTISFHHSRMLELADGPTLCKDPLIVYAFASNRLNSQWWNWQLFPSRPLQNSDWQSLSSINSKDHNGWNREYISFIFSLTSG